MLVVLVLLVLGLPLFCLCYSTVAVVLATAPSSALTVGATAGVSAVAGVVAVAVGVVLSARFMDPLLKECRLYPLLPYLLWYLV